jgi:hypothetical protein
MELAARAVPNNPANRHADLPAYFELRYSWNLSGHGIPIKLLVAGFFLRAAFEMGMRHQTAERVTRHYRVSKQSVKKNMFDTVQ